MTILFLFNIPLHEYNALLFVYSTFDGYVGCFCFLVIMNNDDAMNIGIQVFVWIYGFIFHGQIPRRRLDHMVTLCLTFEDLSYCFPKQLHHSAFYQQSENSNFFPPLPTLCIVWIFYYSHPSIVKRYHSVVWILISFISNDDESFCMYSLAICVSYLHK